MVFRHPGLEHYQRIIEAARRRLADLELNYGVEKSKVDFPLAERGELAKG